MLPRFDRGDAEILLIRGDVLPRGEIRGDVLPCGEGVVAGSANVLPCGDVMDSGGVVLFLFRGDSLCDRGLGDRADSLGDRADSLGDRADCLAK